MDTTTLPTVDLPPELYREIAEALYRPSGRPALLSLSLVNKVWRAESQRVLFRDVRDGYFKSDIDMRRKWLDTHLLFLQAICAHPYRLGPCVHSYGQLGLAWDPDESPGGWFDFQNGKPCFRNDKKDGIILWGLTIHALPSLVNLSRLDLIPRYFKLPNAIGASLSRCNSQLQSLTWVSYVKGDILPDYLLTQKSLLHLDMTRFLPVPQISPVACHSLISIACPFSEVPTFADRRIMAYKLPRLDWARVHLDPVSIAQVKYLSVERYTPRTEFSAIVLLEIDHWELETISILDYLPKLRTLVLGSQRESPDITRDEGARLGVVIEACKRCPTLMRILHTIDTASPYEQRYSQFSITRGLANADCVPTVVYTNVNKDVDFGLLWWEAYGLL